MLKLVWMTQHFFSLDLSTGGVTDTVILTEIYGVV